MNDNIARNWVDGGLRAGQARSALRIAHDKTRQEDGGQRKAKIRERKRAVAKVALR